MDDAIELEEGHLALDGLLIVPAFILWGCSLCMIRSKSDPLRRPWTAVYKTAFFLWTMGVTFDTASSALSVGNYYQPYPSLGPTLSQASDRFYYLGRWMNNLANALVFAFFLELGLAVLLAIQDRRSPMRTSFRAVGWSVFAVLAVLMTAQFGLTQNFLTGYYDPSGLAYIYGPNDTDIYIALTARRLNMAYNAILFILSVGMLSFATFAMTIARKNKTDGNHIPASLFLTCAILWLVARTWDLAENATYSDMYNYYASEPPMWTEVANPILDEWVTFAVLVVAFALGVRKRHGCLWTTDRHPTSPSLQGDHGAYPPLAGHIYTSPPPMTQQLHSSSS